MEITCCMGVRCTSPPGLRLTHPRQKDVCWQVRCWIQSLFRVIQHLYFSQRAFWDHHQYPQPVSTLKSEDTYSDVLKQPHWVLMDHFGHLCSVLKSYKCVFIHHPVFSFLDLCSLNQRELSVLPTFVLTVKLVGWKPKGPVLFQQDQQVNCT